MPFVLKESLRGSSSSSSTDHFDNDNHIPVYDVFLSFRGADTRTNFTDSLRIALEESKIRTFFDDREIETGESLKPELESAIKASRASIIVLSENYATSRWCLDELELILKQQKFGQIVVPIFYHVEPTDVRNQTNSFKVAMEKHERKMKATETTAKERSELAQRMELWKTALTTVADLKGKVATNGKETELIEEVVRDIRRRLGALLRDNPQHLIGMSSYIDIISSWLTNGSCDTTDILTIAGMSGIGKTSLARYVFLLHSREFYKSYWIEDINKKCSDQFNVLGDLQEQLHKAISKQIPLQVNDVSKKLFIVLDDIGDYKQLDDLLGNTCLHPGIKIIITSKDASLTEMCALFKSQVQPKHTMISLNGLLESESLELLCIHAFQGQKRKEGYEEVSEKLVKYCDGHPLAIKLLGSSLQRKDISYWEECIEVLKKGPDSRINKALKLSFKALSVKNDKELFKHIACFFVGVDRDMTEKILTACGIKTKFGIMNLIDKCLISIRGNKLMMHSLIQEMGRELVRQESPRKPWERSRLWNHEESFNVLEKKKGTGNILGLALDTRMLDTKKSSGSFELKTDSLSQMDNLMLLQLNYVQLVGCYDKIPEELRWLCMHGFPLKYIPLDLPMENLVALDMSYSNIEFFDMSSSNQQRTGKKRKRRVGSSSKDNRLPRSLKILNLSFCKQLHTVGGFSVLPALQMLILRNCISLIKVCESVQQCVELLYIDLSYCHKLKSPEESIGKLKKVQTVLLEGLMENQIETIPDFFSLITFPLSRTLRILSLANNKLGNESFPGNMSCLSVLEALCLDKNPIVSMPSCLSSLPRLKALYMRRCRVQSIEYPPPTLEVLSLNDYYTMFDGSDDYWFSLQKIKFDPNMSPLDLCGVWVLASKNPYPFEIDGMVKIQDVADVEEKILHSLGWTNPELIKELHFGSYYNGIGYVPAPVPMFYEFGIFSIIYEGEGKPEWTSFRSNGSSISFTIPSSPYNLRGLNFCCTMVADHFFKLPIIKVINNSKKQTWVYKHCKDSANLQKKFCLSWLSHWMFGPNEMEGGDHVTIDVEHEQENTDHRIVINLPPGLVDYTEYDKLVIKECGIGFVHDDGSVEEDALAFYKSWNYIIGGDLSAFQLTTGEYMLNNKDFMRYKNRPFINKNALFKEDEMRSFKAFKSNVVIKEVE